MADWLSLGHWALVALDKADGDFDFQEKVQTWIAGDWEHVAVSAAAMRNLKGYCESMADAINGYSGFLDQHWDGEAWQAAQLTMISHSAAIDKAAGMLEIAADSYDDVANGLYGVAKDVGMLIQTLIDLLIAAGISAAATVAGSWTLIGAAIGTAATYYGITEIVKTIKKIIALIEGAIVDRRRARRRRLGLARLGRRLAPRRHPRRVREQQRPRLRRPVSTPVPERPAARPPRSGPAPARSSSTCASRSPCCATRRRTRRSGAGSRPS